MSHENKQSAAELPATKSAAAARAPVQGEGDYEAAQRYREEVSEFLAHADVEQLAQRAAPETAIEARELALAADQGRQRSKGDEPADVAAMYPGTKGKT
jgi:hypothetical protein